MAKSVRQESTASSPIAAANFVRHRARAMLAGGAYGSRAFSAERDSLIEWFKQRGQILTPKFFEQFKPVSSGAEHCVYFDLDGMRAIKATHPNRFGHSVLYEGAQATPLEYVRRLALHNTLFGDDIRLLGCILEEEEIEVVTSQPWITAHLLTLPAATDAQIDAYFGTIQFMRSMLFPFGAFFYSPILNLAAADAHSGNVLISDSGAIVAIDVVLGVPGAPLAERLRHEFSAISH